MDVIETHIPDVKRIVPKRFGDARGWFSETYGFAHGFCTLTPDVMVAYKVDSYYSPAHDPGIRWNNPALGIDWPVDEASAILSDKDRMAPLLSEADKLF